MFLICSENKQISFLEKVEENIETIVQFSTKEFFYYFFHRTEMEEVKKETKRKIKEGIKKMIKETLKKFLTESAFVFSNGIIQINDIFFSSCSNIEESKIQDVEVLKVRRYYCPRPDKDQYPFYFFSFLLDGYRLSKEQTIQYRIGCYRTQDEKKQECLSFFVAQKNVLLPDNNTEAKQREYTIIVKKDIPMDEIVKKEEYDYNRKYAGPAIVLSFILLFFITRIVSAEV